MILLISLLVVVFVSTEGFNVAQPARRMAVASSRSSGQLFTPLRQESMSLQMAVNADGMNKVASTAVTVKTKAEMVIKIIMNPVIRLIAAIFKAFNRLIRLGSKTIKRTASGGLSAFETPITIAAIKPKTKFSVSAMKNVLKLGNSESAAKDYVKQKLREIDDAEKVAAKASKKDAWSRRRANAARR